MNRTLTHQALRALFLGALLLSVGIRLPIFQRSILGEDVVMALTASRTLVEGGSLAHWGLSLPFQAIRRGVVDIPVWQALVGPVLFYAPFVSVFGPTDAAFVIGQMCLLALLGFLLIRRMGWCLGVWCLCLVIGLGVLDDALLESRSRLLGVVIVIWLLDRLERCDPRVFRLGIEGCWIGIGTHFRDELVFLLPVALYLIWERRSNARRALLLSGTVVFGVAIGKGAGLLTRAALGAMGSQDHANYIFGIDVFAPGWDVLGLPVLPQLSALWQDPALRALMVDKMLRALRGYLSWRSGPFARGDSWIVFAVLAGLALRCFSLRNHWVGLWLLVAQMALSMLTLDSPRYYDIPVFVLAWQLFRELTARKDFCRRLSAPWVLVLGTWLFGNLFWNGFRAYREARPHMAAFQQQVAIAQSQVPLDSPVITDSWILWNWYAGGMHSVLFPMSRGETMNVLFDRIAGSYAIFFYANHLHQSYQEPLSRRSLLYSANNLLIYGP